MRKSLRDFGDDRPWLGPIICAGMGAVCAVPLVRVELRLPPRGFAQVALFVLGILSLTTLLSIAYKRLDSGTGDAAQMIGLLLFGVGIYFGLGWQPPRGYHDPATLPRGVQAFGAGVVAGFVIFFEGLAVMLVARRRRPATSVPPVAPSHGGEPSAPWNGHPPRGGRFSIWKRKSHAVAVYDVRPDPADPKNQFVPYFIAICDCGWVGYVLSTSEEAFSDARSHDESVADVIQRRVG